MKMLVAGVQRIAGNSKSSGTPFDMCNLACLVPVEIVNGKVQINGTGYKVSELPVDINSLPQFMAIPAAKYPLELDLEVEPRPRNGGFEMVVVGFKSIPLKAAA